MQQLPGSIARIIDTKAEKYSVPRAIARAVAWIESRGNMHATSPAGAMGVMQLMPATAQHFGVSDPYEPTQNIDAGVRMLARQRERFGGWKPALAAYNWGPSRVERNPQVSDWPGQVQRYVSRVLDRAELERVALQEDDIPYAPEPAPLPPTEALQVPAEPSAPLQGSQPLQCPQCGWRDGEPVAPTFGPFEEPPAPDASAAAEAQVAWCEAEKAPTIPPPPKQAKQPTPKQTKPKRVKGGKRGSRKA